MSANVTNNNDVLGVVDGKMAELNSALTKLDDLTAKHAALTKSVADLKKQETEHLRNDAANEDDAVQTLIQLRGKVDVQQARANSLNDQIKEQKAATVGLGNTLGQVLQTLWYQLKANRTARVTRIFDQNFEMPFNAAFSKSTFIEDSRLVRETRDLLSPRFNSRHVPTVDRIAQLRDFSKEFGPLRDAIQKEPDLVLTPVATPTLSVVERAA